HRNRLPLGPNSLSSTFLPRDSPPHAPWEPCPCPRRSVPQPDTLRIVESREFLRSSPTVAGISLLRYHGITASSENSLIPRYTRKEMGGVWSDANKFAKWLEVELAATDTLAEAGLVPKDAAGTIRARAKVDAAHILEIESRVKHDLIAFTMAVGDSIGNPNAA